MLEHRERHSASIYLANQDEGVIHHSGHAVFYQRLPAHFILDIDGVEFTVSRP